MISTRGSVIRFHPLATMLDTFTNCAWMGRGKIASVFPPYHFSQLNMENLKCNICGSDDSLAIFVDPPLSGRRGKGIVRCAHCGLVYRNFSASRTDLFEQYEERQIDHLSEDWVQGRKKVFESYLDTLTTFRKHNRILDIGAGHGYFLASCQQMGWECHGIEPSKQCRSFAEQKFGIRHMSSALELTEYENNFFDVITFWNVLDQLPDPKETLLQVRRLLRVGGAVLIRSPNASFHVSTKRLFAWGGRLIPGLNKMDQSVFHLFSFDKQTISRILTETLFADIHVSPAELSWTTAHDARSSAAKRLVTSLVRGSTKGIYALTCGKILLSPSMVTVATKPMNNG